MPDLEPLVLPALYLLTAALLVALYLAGDGVFRYYLTVKPLYTLVILGTPVIALALGFYPMLVLLHVVGVFLFVGGHAVSAFVAFALLKEENGTRAKALLELSLGAMDWLHIGLAVLITAGIAAGFAGKWWGEPWLWISIDLLLAISAYMYASNNGRGYAKARRQLEEGGPDAWTDSTRALAGRRRAWTFLLSGSATLLAITALMIFKP
jgi:uncharacterized membrane protein